VPEELRDRPVTGERASLVCYAAASGAVDALAFTGLGHVFAGVMTGNLVLLGLAATGTTSGGPTAPLLALAGYVAGAAGAALPARRGKAPELGGWPRGALGCLAVEVLLLALAAVVWALVGPTPHGPVRGVLLVVLASAMGVQSGALAVAGPSAGAGSYFTGTLTTVTVRVSGRGLAGADLWSIARLVAVVGGAALAGGLRSASAVWAAWVPTLPAAAALVCALYGHRDRRSRNGERRRGEREL